MTKLIEDTRKLRIDELRKDSARERAGPEQCVPVVPAGGEGAPQGLNILLVEDDHVNQAFASLILTREGHTVTTVQEGGQALEALRRQRFDLVLMDVRMPGMDGLEATRRIRAADPAEMDPSVPIVALTAQNRGNEAEDHPEGMDGYITKPVDWDEILRTVYEVVEAKKP